MRLHDPLGVHSKRGLLEKVSFQKVDFLEILCRDSRDSRALPDSGKQRRIGPSSGKTLENLEILEILEMSPVKQTFRNDPFFRS